MSICRKARGGNIEPHESCSRRDSTAPSKVLNPSVLVGKVLPNGENWLYLEFREGVVGSREWVFHHIERCRKCREKS